MAYRDRDVVAYGPTALQVLGVALPTALEDWGACHVVVPTGTYRPARAGVVTHEVVMHPRPWRVIDGVPVLHPVDHWLQLRRATEDELIEVGDGFLRRRDPLLSLAALTARVDRL
ncbi:MAG: hypothetical protein FWC46_09390, partial [Actinomycetia bacterium]|nr:hypothetical protein [Actinomycetes bacterium]